ncbi:hypothetical protein EIK56_12840 [Sphingomonas sp. C8-2]|jgi:hypothetical protein|nr:hypothetical protein EIK56_12840 [Sphingomonas sp. C8-2]
MAKDPNYDRYKGIVTLPNPWGPNVTNPKVNKAARIMGRVGRGAGLAGTGFAAADIATAENPWRAGVANVGAVIGGVAGGAGGALAGGFTGLGAPVVIPVLGVAGAIGGGEVGYEIGEELYDFLHRYFR